jgi:hypothetical protein
MKWYMAVRANCQRDKSTSISVGRVNIIGSSVVASFFTTPIDRVQGSGKKQLPESDTAGPYRRCGRLPKTMAPAQQSFLNLET